MSTRELIMAQPTPIEGINAAHEIAALGGGEVMWTIILAISYGIILGKRKERARHKYAQGR